MPQLKLYPAFAKRGLRQSTGTLAHRGWVPKAGNAPCPGKNHPNPATLGPPPHTMTTVLVFPRWEKERQALSASSSRGPQIWSQLPQELARRDALLMVL